MNGTDLNVLVVSLALASGGVVIGWALTTIVYLLQRIVWDLDEQNAWRRADEEALARLGRNLGRRRGRRSSVGTQA